MFSVYIATLAYEYSGRVGSVCVCRASDIMFVLKYSVFIDYRKLLITFTDQIPFYAKLFTTVSPLNS